MFRVFFQWFGFGAKFYPNQLGTTANDGSTTTDGRNAGIRLMDGLIPCIFLIVVPTDGLGWNREVNRVRVKNQRKITTQKKIERKENVEKVTIKRTLKVN